MERESASNTSVYTAGDFAHQEDWVQIESDCLPAFGAHRFGLRVDGPFMDAGHKSLSVSCMPKEVARKIDSR
jgi:hypothetical protein